MLEDSVSAIKSEEKPILQDEKGRFLPGTAPGPGRPQGSFSIKERVKQYLADHPEKMDEFVKYFAEENRDLTWQMLEGRPQQNVLMDAEFKTYEIVRGNEDSSGLISESTSAVAPEGTQGVEPEPVQDNSGGA